MQSVNRRYRITYASCVLSTWAMIASGTPVLSICIASPLLGTARAPTLILDSASVASSRSFVSLAITRTAASCWYRAVLSSCRVSASIFFRVKVSSAKASHSSWNTPSREGIEVRVGGRGLTIRCELRSIRSSLISASPVVGSTPFSDM